MLKPTDDFLLGQVVIVSWKWIGNCLTRSCMIWLRMSIQLPQIFQMTGSAYSKGDQRKEKRLVSIMNVYLTLHWKKHFPITNYYNVYIHLLGLLQRINPAEHPSGYFKTKYKVRRTPNFRTKFDRCVQGFWIAHLRNNR